VHMCMYMSVLSATSFVQQHTVFSSVCFPDIFSCLQTSLRCYLRRRSVSSTFSACCMSQQNFFLRPTPSFQMFALHELFNILLTDADHWSANLICGQSYHQSGKEVLYCTYSLLQEEYL
jgi:hypothetical protein